MVQRGGGHRWSEGTYPWKHAQTSAENASLTAFRDRVNIGIIFPLSFSRCL